MAKWKQVSGEPITTERRVRVYNADDPSREGYADVYWTKERQCRLIERVYLEKPGPDEPTGAPTVVRTILDDAPEFQP